MFILLLEQGIWILFISEFLGIFILFYTLRRLMETSSFSNEAYMFIYLLLHAAISDFLCNVTVKNSKNVPL